MLLEEKYGKDTSVLEKTLAAMLLYTPEEETEWKKILKEKGCEGEESQTRTHQGRETAALCLFV